MTEILTSLHGRQLGLDSNGRLIAPAGIRTGDHGKQFDLESPDTVVLFDDFMGDTLNTFRWHNPTKGSDAGTVDFAISQDVNGKVRGTTGASASASMATNGILIDSGLSWKANQGGLDGQCRVQLSAITAVQLFVGFTDQVSTLEFPISYSGTTLTTNATDATGFLFDTNATSVAYKLVGVANDVDAAVMEASQSTATLTTAPVAATYNTLRVSVDTSGNAYFFIDGKPVGGSKLATAVTPTVALTFVVAAFSGATVRNVDVDYVRVSANRV